MTKYIIANWKSNKTSTEAAHWVTTFVEQLKGSLSSAPVTVIVAVPYYVLPAVQDLLQYGVKLAVQDVSPFAAGAYTGEVAASLLSDLSVSFAIVGHSERRRHLGETHQLVAQKIDQCIVNGIQPILCIDKPYLTEQLTMIPSDQLSRCMIAYEPIAAIGSGNSEDVGTVTSMIHEVREIAGQVPVVYGGSVNSSNILDYTLVSDGALIGSASLDASTFFTTVNSVQSAITVSRTE